MNASEYATFVSSLYLAVKNAETITKNFRTIRFVKNKKLTNSYGVERELDIYWEYQLDDVTYKTAIECKNYATRLSIDRIDALVTKMRDIEVEIAPILATRTGYQSGAESAAKYHNIELLTAREQDMSDWTDEYGQPLIRRIKLIIHISQPATIEDYSLDLDGSWIKENTDIDTSRPPDLSGMNNDILIEDEGRGERYSLRDLASRLTAPAGSGHGLFTDKRDFDEAFVVHPVHGRLRILRHTVSFTTYPPIAETREIDFGAALVGVIEYLQRGEKKLVFKDGVVTRRLPPPVE